MPQAVAAHRSLPGLRACTSATRPCGLLMASPKSHNRGERLVMAKALEAFTTQVEIGELEQWTEEIFVDAWLRGYYKAKAER